MVEINWRKYQSSNKNAVVASAMKLAFLFAMPFLITRRVFTNIDPELGIRELKWSSLCAQKNKGLWQKFGVLSLAGCGAVVTGSCLDILKNVKTATPQKPLQALTDPTIMLRRGT